MQGGSFTESLKLLDSPFVPCAIRVDAVDPDVGIYEGPGTAIVVRETSAGHGAQELERPLRRGGRS